MIEDTFIFERMKSHLGRKHRVRMVGYGIYPIVNMSLECETCGEVLVDFEPEPKEKKHATKRA